MWNEQRVRVGPVVLAMAVLVLAASGRLATAFPQLLNEALCEPAASTEASTASKMLRGHLQFISDPLLQGRAPGSPGEALTADYIQSQLEMYGLAPAGANGGYLQQVPLQNALVTSASPLQVATLDFAWYDDYVATTHAQDATVNPTFAEYVFVGFGISAPGWDDYKGLDVTGKLLVMFVGQPDVGPFAGQPLSYYGRCMFHFASVPHSRPPKQQQSTIRLWLMG